MAQFIIDSFFACCLRNVYHRNPRYFSNSWSNNVESNEIEFIWQWSQDRLPLAGHREDQSCSSSFCFIPNSERLLLRGWRWICGRRNQSEILIVVLFGPKFMRVKTPLRDLTYSLARSVWQSARRSSCLFLQLMSRWTLWWAMIIQITACDLKCSKYI